MDTGIFADVEAFMQEHHACGQVVGDTTPPTEDGYRVWLACPCGARLERWVTLADAERDLTFLAAEDPDG